MPIFSSFASYGEKEVFVVTLGKQKIILYYESFHPGGVCHMDYTTYDTDKELVIEFGLTSDMIPGISCEKDRSESFARADIEKLTEAIRQVYFWE